MVRNNNFNQQSYKKHEGHFYDYIDYSKKEDHAKTWLETTTFDAWRHARM
jgi:hypothetical protein